MNDAAKQSAELCFFVLIIQEITSFWWSVLTKHTTSFTLNCVSMTQRKSSGETVKDLRYDSSNICDTLVEIILSQEKVRQRVRQITHSDGRRKMKCDFGRKTGLKKHYSLFQPISSPKLHLIFHLSPQYAICPRVNHCLIKYLLLNLFAVQYFGMKY